jgi:hypothetical protein
VLEGKRIFGFRTLKLDLLNVWEGFVHS